MPFLSGSLFAQAVYKAVRDSNNNMASKAELFATRGDDYQLIKIFFMSLVCGLCGFELSFELVLEHSIQSRGVYFMQQDQYGKKHITLEMPLECSEQDEMQRWSKLDK